MLNALSAKPDFDYFGESIRIVSIIAVLFFGGLYFVLPLLPKKWFEVKEQKDIKNDQRSEH